MLFVLYLCSATAFLTSPLRLDESLVKLRLTVLLLALLCLLDRTAYTGSCGAYYFPLLFCLAVGGEGSGPAGCAGCQLAHLFMPGLCLGSQKFCCPFLLPRCLKEKRCS